MGKKYFIILIIFTLSIFTWYMFNNNAASSTISPKNQKVNQPKQLEIIESDSEDIMDDINNSDWIKAQSKVNEIKKNMNELKPVLKSSNISSSLIDGLQSTLTELEKQVTAKTIYESKVQANAITKFIPDIADSYKVILPTDLGRLDYIGREIILNVEKKDWISAMSNLNKGKEIWLRIKNNLNAVYQNDITKCADSIKNLDNFINKKDVSLATNEANIFLDKVDILEKDFSNQNK